MYRNNLRNQSRCIIYDCNRCDAHPALNDLDNGTQMTTYQPATQPTMHFIGVTTGKSSIMKIFPAWAEYLGFEADLKGIDFAPNSEPSSYREAVEFIKNDPLSMGALVTTHKVNLFRASNDLFDDLDPFAQALHEVSSISKRDGRLVGHALDPVTVGVGLDAIVPEGHWSETGGHCLILGSGGSSLAMTLNLHNRAQSGQDVPKRVIVTARRDASLEEMRGVHAEIGFSIPIDYVLAPTPEEADKFIAGLPESSVVINATGLGKDAPGSPTSDAVVYPRNAIVWEFNYRGDLLFFEQAKAQAAEHNLKVHDGWVYFVFSWVSVVSQVFDLDLPKSGPGFDALSKIARDVTA